MKIDESFNFEKLISDVPKSTPAFKIKKIEKTSLLDNIEDDSSISHGQIDNEFVIPQSLQQQIQQKIEVKKLSLHRKKEVAKQNMLRVDSVNNDIQNQLQKKVEILQIADIEQQISTEEFQQIAKTQLQEELKQQYYEDNNIEFPQELDIVEIAEELQEAAQNIPDAQNLSISDFDIVLAPEKGGWSKGKVNIKSEVASEELSSIATIVKKSTNNEVLHRAMDFRTIGNTNKTQLKDSNFKLYSCSYTFRPKAGGQIKAQKYARIIISLSAEYNTTKRVLIFIQESRGKFITEINMDIEFIAKLISDYYIVGFDATLALLKSNSGKNPLNVFINKLMLTRKFLVKILYNDVSEETSFDHIIIKSKSSKNQWLKIHIKELGLTKTYGIYAKSSVDSDWKGAKFNHKDGASVPITIDYLMQDDTIQKLDNLFNKVDWAVHGMGEDDVENRQYYLMNKITYRALKNAFIEIYDLSIDENDFGILIKEVLSQIDTAKDLDSGYKAEMIIGKTNYIDYFILSWLAVPIIGGGSRTSTKEDRNYNTRPFMFQITYSINNKEYSKIAKTFSEIKEETGFLTKNPIKL